MKKYKVTCYPIQNSYTTTVEASSIEEAIKEAELEADQNTGFCAIPEDVEEV